MRVIVQEGILKGCVATIGRSVRGITYSDKEGAGWIFKPLTMKEYSQYRKDKAEGIIDPMVSLAFTPDDVFQAYENNKALSFEEERTFSQIQALMRR